jgi:hypothetical protein
MAKKMKMTTGWVVGLGLVFLSLAQFGTTQADAGRDFPRCVQSCNETRTACKSQCDLDCAALWPDGSEELTTCVSDCNSGCIDRSQECKATCQNIKDPPSEDEP